MVFGLGNKGRTVDRDTQVIDTNDSPAAKEGAFAYDPEVQDGKGRKMSRIGGAGIGSDSDSQLSVGKQVELEASNAIKYRTCSWQKVS